MELTEQQKDTLRQIYGARGDVLEAVMVKRPIDCGVDERRARTAARECTNRIWRNSMRARSRRRSGVVTAAGVGSTRSTPVGHAPGVVVEVFKLATHAETSARHQLLTSNPEAGGMPEYTCAPSHCVQTDPPPDILSDRSARSAAGVLLGSQMK